MRSLAKILSSLIALSVFTAACGTNAPAVAESNKSRVTNPNIPAADLTTLVDGNNAFALDVYRSLHSETGNLILSPFSMSLALAMTYAGARGETESQMADVLHFTQSQETLHPAFNALDLALEDQPLNLNKDQEPMTLSIANSVWAEQTYPFKTDFLDMLALNYGAGVKLTDFKIQPDPSRKQINQWVSDETKDKIQDLLPENSVNTDTRMVLVNAIYFKADWASPFDADATSDAPFNLLDGSQVTVKMMRDHGSVAYYAGDGFQAIELPYAGNTAAMDIILPDAENFESFESAFDQQTYNTMVKGFQSSSAVYNLPKFSFTKDFNLSDALKGMGMTDAFDPDLANFSGMSDQGNLSISNVIHKAFVAVDEKGTEAAAATAVIMEGATALMPNIDFNADHPFLFVIRDTVNGQILFVGRVLNPVE